MEEDTGSAGGREEETATSSSSRCHLVRQGRDRQGLRTIGSFVDVTERRRGGSPQKARQMPHMVESANDPCSDRRIRPVAMPTSQRGVLGTLPNHVIGKTVDELFPSHRRAVSGGRQVIRPVRRWSPKTCSKCTDASSGSAASCSRSILREDHVAQAIMRDITKLKETEQALRESERLRRPSASRTSGSVTTTFGHAVPVGAAARSSDGVLKSPRSGAVSLVCRHAGTCQPGPSGRPRASVQETQRPRRATAMRPRYQSPGETARSGG
jgi:hypothetical protein